MSVKKIGFLQAFGVAAYCSLIGLILFNSNSIFGKMNSVVGPALFLLLFATSALICGALVFYKPYKFFIDGKKKEALDAVISTIVWLFVFVLLFFSAMFIFK